MLGFSGHWIVLILQYLRGLTNLINRPIMSYRLIGALPHVGPIYINRESKKGEWLSERDGEERERESASVP